MGWSENVRCFRYLFLLLLFALPATGRGAELASLGQLDTRARLLISPVQLFAFAQEALRRGDTRTAETAFRALAANPDVQIRTEARFRLGIMYATARRPTDAAVLFRQILDEQPAAQRVRLELARTLDLLGDEAGARRALREAQAGGLPTEVARLVDRYSVALRAKKPFGASFEIAFAPDSNINRATRSDTLGTVLGDFTLDGDAKQRSGIGAALSGQAYRRMAISDQASMLVRLSGKGDLYRHAEFNDLGLGIAAGPELRLGRNRISAEAGMTWRWFGGKPYSMTASGAVSYLRPLGPKAQLRATAVVATISNKRNSLQGGRSYSLSAAYERALSPVMGLALTASGERFLANDAGYSSKAWRAGLIGWRDVGRATLTAGAEVGQLQADERLLLFPEKRSDNYRRFTLGATLRQFTFGGFAPITRLTYERNRSSIEFHDYRRTRTEVGISRAF